MAPEALQESGEIRTRAKKGLTMRALPQAMSIVSALQMTGEPGVSPG